MPPKLYVTSQYSGFADPGTAAQRCTSWSYTAPELLPTLLDHEWAVFIHSYFGAKPYWEPNAQHA